MSSIKFRRVSFVEFSKNFPERPHWSRQLAVRITSVRISGVILYLIVLIFILQIF